MKKGFTLIELLAVISILALIAVVVFPAINSVIQGSRNKAYEDQVKLIEKAAEEWALDNADTLKAEENFETSVSISTLTSGGYIAEDEEEVLNPKKSDDSIMEGEVKITYEVSHNQFEFDYDESADES